MNRPARIATLAAVLAGLVAAAAAPACAQVAFAPVERTEVARPSGASAYAIVHAVPVPFEGSVASVRYLPDGRRVLATSDDGEVALFEVGARRTVWRTRPFPDSDNAIFCLDVDPAGERFLTATGIGAREDHTSLNLHAVSDGAIRTAIEEDSRFYQPGVDVDHRKPAAAEIRRREEMGLGPNWRVVPRRARFIAGGGRILAYYENLGTGANLYDRSIRAFEAATGRKLWEVQIVAEEEGRDDGQPAGFRISLPAPPLCASPDGAIILYGTPHARIHALDAATIAENAPRERVEDMRAAPVLAHPRAGAGEGLDDFGMGIHDLALSPDRAILFAAAGEAGHSRVLAYDVATGAEIARSTVFDVARIAAGPGGRLLVAGAGGGAGGRLHIFDVKAGALLYAGPRYGSLDTAAFDVSPKGGEACVAGAGALHFLRERPVRRIAVGSDWTRTGLYLRRGVSLRAWGRGAIELSTGVGVAPEERWSVEERDELAFGSGDGRGAIVEDGQEGEVVLRAEPEGAWTVVGGLTEAEFDAARRAP